MTRSDAVRDLIAFRQPIGELRQALSVFPWDSDELATIGVEDVLAVLDRFSQGLLSAGEVADWADAVELRDDIGMSTPGVREAIYAPATPELEGPLTLDAAAAWRGRLA